MIHLTATTTSLEVKLSGAITTSQLVVTSHWSEYDDTAGTLTQGETSVLTNDTTAVTAVAAPASGLSRNLDFLSVYNADTAAATVIVQTSESGTKRVLVKHALAAGETLQYTRNRGFL